MVLGPSHSAGHKAWRQSAIFGLLHISFEIISGLQLKCRLCVWLCRCSPPFSPPGRVRQCCFNLSPGLENNGTTIYSYFNFKTLHPYFILNTLFNPYRINYLNLNWRLCVLLYFVKWWQCHLSGKIIVICNLWRISIRHGVRSRTLARTLRMILRVIFSSVISHQHGGISWVISTPKPIFGAVFVNATDFI